MPTTRRPSRSTRTTCGMMPHTPASARKNQTPLAPASPGGSTGVRRSGSARKAAWPLSGNSKDHWSNLNLGAGVRPSDMSLPPQTSRPVPPAASDLSAGTSESATRPAGKRCLSRTGSAVTPDSRARRVRQSDSPEILGLSLGSATGGTASKPAALRLSRGTALNCSGCTRTCHALPRLRALEPSGDQTAAKRLAHLPTGRRAFVPRLSAGVTDTHAFSPATDGRTPTSVSPLGASRSSPSSAGLPAAPRR